MQAHTEGARPVCNPSGPPPLARQREPVARSGLCLLQGCPWRTGEHLGEPTVKLVHHALAECLVVLFGQLDGRYGGSGFGCPNPQHVMYLAQSFGDVTAVLKGHMDLICDAHGEVFVMIINGVGQEHYG